MVKGLRRHKGLALMAAFALVLLASARTAPAQDEAGAAGMADTSNPKEQEILDRAQGDETLMTAEGFTYDPKGRRDPFESIWNRKREAGDRPAGIRGMEISELDLQGIVITMDGGKFAIVLGTDNKGYNLREGDELFNGKVKTIEKDRVTFLQKVNDPLSIKEYTEVAKRLNPDER